MKIELHILQNFAPSCLNRDDVNAPKTCQFGGANRARISSQSYKRAVREYFRAENGVPIGVRTKRLKEILEERLGEAVSGEAITTFLTECYSKMDGKRTDETAVLLFVSGEEIDEAERCLREGVASKEAIGRLRAARKSADVALFGRMLAEKPESNVDAACQVAHAFSSHASDPEIDFYTAVDDRTEERDEIGAGMMGTQGYNSACFYRYALLDFGQLARNLGDRAMAAATTRAFLRAFSLAIPRAKQNSHAAQNLPSFALFAARERGAPVSLANAFAQPIRGEDLIGASVRALCGYQKRLGDLYGLYDEATLALIHDREENKHLGGLAAYEVSGLDAAVDAVMTRVSRWI
jgi:CRISPR system Cascade subunit CasC